SAILIGTACRDRCAYSYACWLNGGGMSGREHPDSGIDGIDVAELGRLWADGVVPVSEALISEEMPAETRAFLTGFGLPARETYVVEVYHDERLTQPDLRGGGHSLPIRGEGTA